ncbi:MAG: hypothetical protein ACOCUJ_00265 [Thiohalospira sp.]
MENWGKWKLVKAGFLLGIGFIVPLLVVGAANPVVTSLSFQVMAQSAFESSEEEVVASSSFSPAEMDVTQSIELGDHREKMQNGQLRVLSSLENVGDQEASMVEVEWRKVRSRSSITGSSFSPLAACHPSPTFQREPARQLSLMPGWPA